MKRVSVVLVILAAAGIANAALHDFEVDPSANWLGYINIFDHAGTFQFGFPEGNLSTASANFLPGPANPLTLSPNTRLYDENVGDPFWVDQGTFQATLVSEFNVYQEVFGAVGDTATFDFSTIASNIPAGYGAIGFIKVLDGFQSWGTYQFEQVPLVAGQIGSLSLTVNDSGLSAGGTPLVQAGFALTGEYISSGDPIAATGVQIVPEPTTMVLLGLGGLLIRRRK